MHEEKQKHAFLLELKFWVRESKRNGTPNYSSLLSAKHQDACDQELNSIESLSLKELYIPETF